VTRVELRIWSVNINTQRQLTVEDCSTIFNETLFISLKQNISPKFQYHISRNFSEIGPVTVNGFLYITFYKMVGCILQESE
jgi:hypothetical protein